jgi:outer membrane protein TolC
MLILIKKNKDWVLGALVLCLLLAIGAKPVRAQTRTMNLSLQNTIEIATDSSLQAFVAKNQYQSSYWAYRVYKAGRLPSLTLNMTPLRYIRNITSRYDSETNLDIYREQQYLNSGGSLSVRQNFDLTGGTFYLDTGLEYMRNLGNSSFSQFSSVPFRIGYDQSLFGFNSFKWEKQIEPLKYEKAKKKYIYDREMISESSVEYFFNLVMAQTEYDMAIDNAASSDTMYWMGEERFKIASIEKSDLLTLKLEAVNAKNTLKNAEINLQRASFAFVSFLNMDKETPVRLNLPDRPKDLEIPIEAALQYAKENNPDFLTNKQDILESEQAVDRAKKSAAFDATLSASVGINRVSSTFADAYRNPEQQNIVSVGLSIPLVDWGIRKGRVNTSISNLNVIRFSVQQKEISLEQDIVMTINDFNVQQDMIRSAEEAMELANIAYNTAKERFIIGNVDINYLSLSLNRQKDARKNYVTSMKSYWMSFYKIRRLTLYDFDKQQTLRVEY